MQEERGDLTGRIDRNEVGNVRDRILMSGSINPGTTKPPPNIVIGTPQRILDHLVTSIREEVWSGVDPETRSLFSLKDVKSIVFDEVDRMMSQGFHSMIGKLRSFIDHCGENSWGDVIKILVSATLSIDSAQFHELSLSAPILLSTNTSKRKNTSENQIKEDEEEDETMNEEEEESKMDEEEESSTHYQFPSSLSQQYLVCKSNQKTIYLFSLIQKMREDGKIIIVFSSSAETVHQLATLLTSWKDGSKVQEISSNLSREERRVGMMRIKEEGGDDGGVEVVVASDGFARGMDVRNSHLVINYDLPSSQKAYVHRVGRTARAGNRGTALSFVTQGRIGFFLDKLVGGEVDQIEVDIEDVKSIQPAFELATNNTF